MTKTWGDLARATIRQVLDANPNADKKELRKLLRAAYPFGMRKYHPYKVWCEQVRIALGEQKTKKGKPALIAKEQGALL